MALWIFGPINCFDNVTSQTLFHWLEANSIQSIHEMRKKKTRGFIDEGASRSVRHEDTQTHTQNSIFIFYFVLHLFYLPLVLSWSEIFWYMKE